MTQYQRGQRIQYKARDELRGEGYHTMISSRSLGPFDLIAWNALRIRFIQVKSCRIEKYYFPKDELKNLVQEEIPSCGDKEVWIWLKNRAWRKWKCSFFGEDWKLAEGKETLVEKESKKTKDGKFPKPF